MIVNSCLILFFTLIIPMTGYGQHEVRLKIFDVRGEINQESFAMADTLEETLVIDQVKEVMIYRQGAITYITSFEFKQAGKRLKLRTRNYVVEKGKDPVFGKWKKAVEFTNVGISGEFFQSGGEYLLLDKEALRSMRAHYKLKLTYL